MKGDIFCILINQLLNEALTMKRRLYFLAFTTKTVTIKSRTGFPYMLCLEYIPYKKMFVLFDPKLVGVLGFNYNLTLLRYHWAKA